MKCSGSEGCLGKNLGTLRQRCRLKPIRITVRGDVNRRRRARAAEWGSLLRSCLARDRRFKSCRLHSFDRRWFPPELPGYSKTCGEVLGLSFPDSVVGRVVRLWWSGSGSARGEHFLSELTIQQARGLQLQLTGLLYVCAFCIEMPFGCPMSGCSLAARWLPY